MKNLSSKYQPWVEARTRFHLSHAHIQMARELGLNPKKLGKLANHDQEPWKAPLPEFIAQLYRKRFDKVRPADVRPLEVIIADQKRRKAERKAQKREMAPGPRLISPIPGAPEAEPEGVTLGAADGAAESLAAPPRPGELNGSGGPRARDVVHNGGSPPVPDPGRDLDSRPVPTQRRQRNGRSGSAESTTSPDRAPPAAAVPAEDWL
jgi:hypothetical protein